MRTQRGAETQAEGEQALSWEPDSGFHLRTLGSQLETKAVAQPLNHPGSPAFTVLNISLLTHTMAVWVNVR